MFFSIRNSLGANKFISPAAVLWPSVRPESLASRGTVVRFSRFAKQSHRLKGDARHERLPYVFIARQISSGDLMSRSETAAGRLAPPILKSIMEFSEIVKASGFDKTANPASAVALASVRADPDDDRPWSRRGQPIITQRNRPAPDTDRNASELVSRLANQFK